VPHRSKLLSGVHVINESNLVRVPNFARAKRVTVSVVTKRVQFGHRKVSPEDIRSFLKLGIHRPKTLIAFGSGGGTAMDKAALLYNVEAVAISAIDDENEFGGDTGAYNT
jgi:hypothetical protein